MDRGSRKRPVTNMETSPRFYSRENARRRPNYFRNEYIDTRSEKFYKDSFDLIPQWNFNSPNDRSLSFSQGRKRNNADRHEPGRQELYEPGNKRQRQEYPDQTIPAGTSQKELRLKKLAEEIKEYSAMMEQSQELLEKKLRLRDALLNIFRKSVPEANLFLVGSSCNGFANNSSDADFCLMIDESIQMNQKRDAVKYLFKLQKLLRSCAFIRKLQLIRAKVPILKFSDTVSGCECDVNINNSIGIRNTHLLRTYSRVESRVRPLLMTVKRWAKRRGINDASQGTLSSYSIALLVIHFLQCGCKPPVIPSLQSKYPQHFSMKLNLNDLPMFEPADQIPCDSSENEESLGRLLVKFFEYYGKTFRWEYFAPSVRQGTALIKAMKDEWRNSFICIEEPFEETNTARAVRSAHKFRQIKEEFRMAYETMEQNPSLENLLR